MQFIILLRFFSGGSFLFEDVHMTYSIAEVNIYLNTEQAHPCLSLIILQERVISTWLESKSASFLINTFFIHFTKLEYVH